MTKLRAGQRHELEHEHGHDEQTGESETRGCGDTDGEPKGMDRNVQGEKQLERWDAPPEQPPNEGLAVIAKQLLSRSPSKQEDRRVDDTRRELCHVGEMIPINLSPKDLLVVLEPEQGQPGLDGMLKNHGAEHLSHRRLVTGEDLG
jgi:hypothetical protein